MNTRTFLSNFPTFVKRWQAYRKKLGGRALGWTVMSDYCLDDPNKANCITFIISPILGQPEQVAKVLNNKLPADIKNMKHVPKDTINFIRDRKEFFISSFLLSDKQKLVDLQYFKTDILSLSESPLIPDRYRKKLEKFFYHLNKKRLHKKVVQNLSLIVFWFAKIVEFLTIKHNAEEIHWFPDRDDIMKIGDGIILELANINYNNAIARRKNTPKVRIGIENPYTRKFIFDPFIRYADIVNGVFSSIPSPNVKEKHIQILKDSMVNNPRIVWFLIYPEKMRCFDMVALKILYQRHINHPV